jgi:hypothetical protein
MNVTADDDDDPVGDMHQIGPLTYRQGHVLVWMEDGGCRENALMHDRAVVAAFCASPPDEEDQQLFRAWVTAEELPLVLAQWARVLSACV